MNNNILLSICIPTYNRGDILENTLKTYVNDPEFDERVEIVISDNCSSDNTEECISKYLSKYKNIKYKRLQENIGPDLNMSTVLLMGSGLYLKLMNDSASMKSGVLKSMIDILNSAKNGMKPTFFYQNIPFLNSNKIVICSTLNEFVSNATFMCTWISNFGIWRKDFELLENKDRFAELQFTQTDWLFRLMDEKKEGIIHFGDYYCTIELQSKGGYNVFQTFGVKYLTLYNEYLESNSLNRKVYNIEKYRLFRYFLMNWYQTLVLLKDNKFIFEKNDAIKILMINYKSQPYFYLGIVFLFLRKWQNSIRLFLTKNK